MRDSLQDLQAAPSVPLLSVYRLASVMCCPWKRGFVFQRVCLTLTRHGCPVSVYKPPRMGGSLLRSQWFCDKIILLSGRTSEQNEVGLFCLHWRPASHPKPLVFSTAPPHLLPAMQGCPLPAHKPSGSWDPGLQVGARGSQGWGWGGGCNGAQC